MANESEQGFAISCPDGLWVTGLVEVSGKQRWVLGVEEERVIYPTCTAAYLELNRMVPLNEEGYKVVELLTGQP